MGQELSQWFSYCEPQYRVFSRDISENSPTSDLKCIYFKILFYRQEQKKNHTFSNVGLYVNLSTLDSSKHDPGLSGLLVQYPLCRKASADISLHIFKPVMICYWLSLHCNSEHVTTPYGGQAQLTAHHIFDIPVCMRSHHSITELYNTQITIISHI